MSHVFAWGWLGGRPINTTRQTVAMTVGADTATHQVPDGEMWIIHGVFFTNNSGQNIDCFIEIRDASGNRIGRILAEQTVNDAVEIHLPREEGTEDLTEWGHGFYPFPLWEGQSLILRWGALAGKAGNSYYVITGRKITVEMIP